MRGVWRAESQLPCVAASWLRRKKTGVTRRRTAVILDGMDEKATARFWASVEKTDTCWRWRQRLIPTGYGQFNINGEFLYAHRVAYELTGRVIPDGYVIDHLCRNRWCVNPDHLEAVTQRENCRRGRLGQHRGPRGKYGKHLPKGSLYCRRGHLRTAETVYLSPKGHADCRVCHNERKRLAYRKNIQRKVTVTPPLSQGTIILGDRP